ncbi:nuclear transport factor 2 family protein [Actinoplanes sp. CA-030573]|uniref:nuclear transport factor 2 family protein n=1 Tax=Actinoplanes sp. CA-030573 TaxID=3239898 RepID=UPI003D9253CB
MTTTVPDISTLAHAIESRDAATITAWYHPDAVLTLVDRDHPPSSPLVFASAEEIGAYYRDVCGRNMAHEVSDAVITADGMAFTQNCRYPDGTKVLCVTVARLADGRITSQTATQVWDG